VNSNKVPAILLSGLLAAGLSACGGSGDEGESAAVQSGMPGMAGMPPSDADSAIAAAHSAEGTLNSMDLDAGTANISHGPVPSANWPEMTMEFKLGDPDSARALEPGQRIRFEFTIEGGMSASVTKIERID